MLLLRRILVAAALSWSFSSTLGVLYATGLFGKFALSSLRLPGVIQLSILFSSVISVVILPFAVWSLRAGLRNMLICTPLLWLSLATYIVVVIPRGANLFVGFYPYGLFALAIGGLILIGFLPAAK